MAAVKNALVKTATRPPLRLPPLAGVHDLLRLYRIRALKSFSQNFLLNERITDKFVKSAGKLEGIHVCEVGPGPGSITRSIMRQNPAQLTVIEKDERFLPTLELLRDSCKSSINFNIITGDILKTNLEDVFRGATKCNWDEKPPSVHLIGNLPFSVSTILLIRWLEAMSTKSGAWAYGRTRMTLTFQKEVAERMAAREAEEQRCRLSVMCQNWCKVDHKYNILGKSFIPPPDVDVGVVTLTPLKEPIIKLDFKLIEKLLRNTFNMRQKYSRRSVSTLFPEDLREDLTERIFEMADVDPLIRPYQISNFEFKRLCHAYNELIKEYPHIASYDFRAYKTSQIINTEKITDYKENLL
ncbi:mitochondrial transcription factor B1 [Arctopsyche grandis]|uniref:mitochondrial transcription factor B1 n=1 Tax=Arctopsyche grandis TaxID=121162 RepID=UPI00406D70FB